MQNVKIFKLIVACCAILLALATAYAFSAEPDLLPLILIQRQREAAGMTPHADPASPITAGRSEPAAKAATSRPSAPPVVIRAADHSAQASKKVAITPPRQAPSGPHWTHPGSSRTALINHLLSHSKHAGLHTRAQLESLSYAELEAAHDRDHNAARKPVQSSCPNGNCGNPTRRMLFGWRR